MLPSAVPKCAPWVQRLDETGKTEGPSGLTFVIRVVTFPLPLRGREYWVAPLKRRSSQWPFTTAGFILRKRLPKGTVHLFGRYVQQVGRQLVAAYRNTRKKKYPQTIKTFHAAQCMLKRIEERARRIPSAG